MTAPDLDALRAAVERNAQAVVEGNFAQLMADITPEALAQMMQMAPGTASAASVAQLPSITGFTISEKGVEGEAHSFEVTFDSAAGTATLMTTWAPVVGQWKITGVSVVSLTPAPSDPPPE